MGLASTLGNLFGRLAGRGGSKTPPVATLAPPPTARHAPAELDTRNVDRRTQLDEDRTAKGKEGEAEFDESMAGGFMPVISSWVQGIRWVQRKSEGPNTGVLYVMFRSGAICEYSGISEAFYDEFFAAGSKGRFVWLYLYHRPYRLVQAGTRSSGGRRTRRR